MVAVSPFETTAAIAPSTRVEHIRRVDQLFREHYQLLVRFLWGRLACEQEAKDVAQEAYMRVLNLERPEAVSYLKPFLFKTAANLAIDRVRRRRTAEQKESESAQSGVYPSPELLLSHEQDVAITLQALDELPAACRTAFLLSRLDGLSQAEIATRLGVTDRAVRKYLVRALLHLQSHFEQAEVPA